MSWTPVSVPSAATLCVHATPPSAQRCAASTNVTASPAAPVRLRSPASAPWTSVGWLPDRRTPVPIWLVTKTRSPQTIGVDTPAPSSRARQATPCVALQLAGSDVSTVTPFPCAPRHWGQLSATTGVDAVTSRAEHPPEAA